MARQRRRGGWLSSLLGGAPGDPPGTTYELRVLEGADSGAVFPLDRPQLQIGRRIPGETSVAIGLTDRSVSARHALVSCEGGEVIVEHLPSATNPTLVNGRRIKRKQVRDGDRIVLGLVVLELCAKRPLPELREGGRIAPSQIETDPVNVQGELVLREGIEGCAGARFPLIRRRTSIGRDEDCDIVLDLSSVSREHAALVFENDQLVLIHESAVNPTHVNGMQIRDRRRIFHGDEIRISERVVFDVQLEAAEVKPSPPRQREDEATRFSEVPQPPTPTPTPIPSGEEEATRFTSPPSPPEPRSDPARATSLDAESEEATLVTGTVAPPVPGPPQPETVPPEADATVVQAAPTVVEAGETDPALTDLAEAPEGAREMPATIVETAPDAPTPEPDTTPPAPDPGAFADGNATRIAPVPRAADYSGGDATRVAPAPDAAARAEADATRVAPTPSRPPGPASESAPGPVPGPGTPPDRSGFQDGAATRIAPAPDLGAEAADRTRIVENDRNDADATLIRPRPGADPDAAEHTRIVDLDPALDVPEPADEARTVVRQRPAADDPAATLVRPRPPLPSDPKPAQTVLLDGDATDAGDDEDDEQS